MKKLDKQKLRGLVSEVMEDLPIKGSFQGRDKDELVQCVRETRETVEYTTAKLEDIYNLTQRDCPEMADWARGMVEDQKDLYQELMDFETELRTK